MSPATFVLRPPRRRSGEQYIAKRESRLPADHCPACRGWQYSPPDELLLITDRSGTRVACACSCHVRLSAPVV